MASLVVTKALYVKFLSKIHFHLARVPVGKEKVGFGSC